jgi:hypothetical protein
MGKLVNFVKAFPNIVNRSNGNIDIITQHEPVCNCKGPYWRKVGTSVPRGSSGAFKAVTGYFGCSRSINTDALIFWGEGNQCFINQG